MYRLTARRSLKVAALTALASAWWLLGSSAANAAPVLGGKILTTAGGNVTITILPSTSLFVNPISLVSPGPSTLIGTDDEFGKIVVLGPFAAGNELLFSIDSPEGTFFTGPAFRNPDGLAHAVVDFTAPGVAIVGFEDLVGGGDLDFDDAVFRIEGAIGPGVVPEPATMSLLGMGLAGTFFARRRRQRRA
jgi:hypothetical protein